MYEYQLIDGMYCLFQENGERVNGIKPISEVAILFDKQDNTLIRYGCPELVHENHKKIRDKLYATKNPVMQDMADDMVVMSGKFPVEELNKCINISGYAGKMHEKFFNAESTDLDEKQKVKMRF